MDGFPLLSLQPPGKECPHKPHRPRPSWRNHLAYGEPLCWPHLHSSHSTRLQSGDSTRRVGGQRGHIGRVVLPLSLSRLTTQPFADAVHLPLQIDSRLVEPDFGYGEGLIDQEMYERFPKARAAFMQDPAANFLPGGDDPVHAAQRGTEALRDIASFAEPGSRVLVVAHNTLLRIVLCELLQIPISRYRSTFPKLANGTLTEIYFDSGHTSLLSFNSPILAST